jgi:L-lactate dehydrogenase complex protein LldG
MSILQGKPSISATELWDRFEKKASALGASVVYAAREARLDTAADDAVCRADFAVAETGSLAVSLPNEERRRALLAERLWLQVQRQDIVATLDEALQRVATSIIDGNNHYATFMSGPSRTADIERTLTIGVHGPRAVTVVVIGATSS